MPLGIGIKKIQSILGGYLFGYPGLFKELFITDPHPMKESQDLEGSVRNGAQCN